MGHFLAKSLLLPWSLLLVPPLQWTLTTGRSKLVVGRKVGSWVVGSSVTITRTWWDLSPLPTSDLQHCHGRTRSGSQGSGFTIGTLPWVSTSVFIRYKAHHCMWQVLPLWNAILPLHGLCGLWRVVGNHRNDVVKQRGSWHVIKCYRRATPEQSPSGGVTMDVLVVGLGRDVLCGKSSTGWRTALAWEGRYQLLMQLKVLKSPETHYFYTGFHAASDLPSCAFGAVFSEASYVHM